MAVTNRESRQGGRCRNPGPASVPAAVDPWHAAQPFARNTSLPAAEVVEICNEWRRTSLFCRTSAKARATSEATATMLHTAIWRGILTVIPRRPAVRESCDRACLAKFQAALPPWYDCPRTGAPLARSPSSPFRRVPAARRHAAKLGSVRSTSRNSLSVMAWGSSVESAHTLSSRFSSSRTLPGKECVSRDSRAQRESVTCRPYFSASRATNHCESTSTSSRRARNGGTSITTVARRK